MGNAILFVTRCAKLPPQHATERTDPNSLDRVFHIISQYFDALPLITQGPAGTRQEKVLNFVHGLDNVGQQLIGRDGELYLQDATRPFTAKENEVCKSFATTVLKSIPRSKVDLYNPVVKPIKGAQTLRHTDAFRGGHYNSLLFLEKPHGSALVMRTDISFRTSVVELNGKLFIPLGYLPQDYITFIGLRGEGPKIDKFLFDGTAADAVRVVGDISDRVVVASSEDSLLVMPRGAGPGSKSYPVSFQEFLEEALRNPPARGEDDHRVYMGEVGVWSFFQGWRYIHWYEGNPNVRRIHVCNRTVDRNPQSDVDLDDPTTFVDCRS